MMTQNDRLSTELIDLSINRQIIVALHQSSARKDGTITLTLICDEYTLYNVTYYIT